MVNLVIKQRETYVLSSFSYGCSGVPSELSVVLIVVSVNRCGLSCFCFLVFRKTSRFFLFLPTLCDFLTVELMDVGRQQRTAAVLGFQHAEVLDRQCGGVDKSVRGTLNFIRAQRPSKGRSY